MEIYRRNPPGINVKWANSKGLELDRIELATRLGQNQGVQGHDPAGGKKDKTEPPRWPEGLFGGRSRLHKYVRCHGVGIDRLGLHHFVQSAGRGFVQNEAVDQTELESEQ